MILRISERPDFAAEWTDRRDDVVMHNPRIGAIQHIITCDGTGQPKYDQPLLVTRPGVVCVVRDANLNLALLQRYREVCVQDHDERSVPTADGVAFGALSLEFPRGGCEVDETAVVAALRETEEETGCTAIGAQWLDRINPDTAFFPYCHDVFLVDVDAQRRADVPLDPNEVIEQVAFERLPNLLKRISDGQIHCGLTKAALTAYFAYLARQGELSAALG